MTLTMYDLQISVGFMTNFWCQFQLMFTRCYRCLCFCLVAQEKYKLLDPQRRKSVRCEIRPLGQKRRPPDLLLYDSNLF